MREVMLVRLPPARASMRSNSPARRAVFRHSRRAVCSNAQDVHCAVTGTQSRQADNW